MVDLIDLLIGQLTRLAHDFTHLDSLVIFAHEEVALHAAFEGFKSLERLLCDAEQALIAFSSLIIIALFILDTSHLQQGIVCVVVVGLRQYIIKVFYDLVFRPYPFSTFEAIIVRLQQISASLEVVEIILQGGLGFLILSIKVEALSIGKGQGILLGDLHLTTIGVDIAKVLIQIVLLHIDAADDVHGFARLVGIGIGGHQILQIGQCLIVLIVVIINHADLHHGLARIT